MFMRICHQQTLRSRLRCSHNSTTFPHSEAYHEKFMLNESTECNPRGQWRTIGKLTNYFHIANSSLCVGFRATAAELEIPISNNNNKSTPASSLKICRLGEYLTWNNVSVFFSLQLEVPLIRLVICRTEIAQWKPPGPSRIIVSPKGGKKDIVHCCNRAGETENTKNAFVVSSLASRSHNSWESLNFVFWQATNY